MKILFVFKSDSSFLVNKLLVCKKHPYNECIAKLFEYVHSFEMNVTDHCHEFDSILTVLLIKPT